MIRFLTAGESHGPALTAIIEGLPAGLPLTAAAIQADLDRRRQGYGRGGRMQIEGDQVAILSGVRHGSTLGSPVTLQILNRDWERWQEVMAVAPGMGSAAVTIDQDERISSLKANVTAPRPGHADLAGALKYQQSDIRNILERASARETAARVSVGAVARRILQEFEIEVFSGVLQIGTVRLAEPPEDMVRYREEARNSPVAAPDSEVSRLMTAEIDRAKSAGDSLGGVIEVIARGVPPGLGSHVHWERRLDSRLAGALMSIPAIKGVSVGLGFQAAGLPGSQVHDEIGYAPGQGYSRRTNHAGGIEGGISNGEMIRVSLAMKPIPTLYRPLRTVDIVSKEPVQASVERSDTCAVPAAAVVAEAMVCWVLAEALTEKCGGDHLEEMRAHYRDYLAAIRSF
ncbi:chorismate synthase [Hydrogenispora ethanolica]|uniref:Chorismate synthase n=1 Tax=Hydrogenispora ethanolica TaxID=1082276 RepID=A0A4R1RXS8_HYDET|nr:chorismate synthase [Hydrogenispora ethanolica]TCL70782.1 chorismate synthase [Hydrogenispora ethanolica]